MKTIKTLVFATTMIATGSAFAMSDPAQDYLKDSHLIDASVEAATVVQRAPVSDLDPATDYLVKSGLVDAPTMAVESDGKRAAVNGISPDLNYWEAPAS